jgi:hypothetical protein
MQFPISDETEKRFIHTFNRNYYVIMIEVLGFSSWNSFYNVANEDYRWKTSLGSCPTPLSTSARLSSNEGAMTRGTTSQTVDGMALRMSLVWRQFTLSLQGKKCPVSCERKDDFVCKKWLTRK